MYQLQAKLLPKSGKIATFFGRFCYLTLILFILVSCDTTETKKKTTTRRTTDSAPYELLLVADKDWLQTSDGSVLTDVVYAEIPGLPAPESNFKVISINPSGFNKTFQSFANIVYIDFGSQYDKPDMRIAVDVYAHPQKIVYLTAPNGRALAELAMQRGEQIIDIFVNAELQRERELLTRHHSTTVLNQVKELFGYTMYAPANIDASKTGEDFIWASSSAEDNRINICVYTYPYVSEEDFSHERFIQTRDSVMRINILGEKPGQYMATNPQTVLSRTTTFNNQFLFEARGLWEMKHDMMGGPFVSYSRIDTTRQLVVVAEGFVYAPEKKKRAYIRELEAALQTLTLNQ